MQNTNRRHTMKKTEIADNFHNMKYNCCQSVVMTYAEELGLDPKTTFVLTEGFGAGMGGMQGACGALSGVIALAGAKNSDGNLEAPATKVATYKIVKEIVAKFEERVGALNCCDIKGINTGKVLCSCPNCIRIGVEIAQEVLGLPEE